MRLDPLDVFSHTAVSMPGRFLLAWILGTLGAFIPILIGSIFESWFGVFGVIQWQFLLLPLYLLLIALVSGWWSFVAVPLLLVFAWKFIVFLRGDGDSVALGWIFLLPCLIGFRTSGDGWPLVAILSGALAVRLWRCREDDAPLF
ncbi:hypothetical protein N9Y81_02315 [Akkermansiaceae bacterium]|jgi:hypothetical protein|nr:hypothetical protein [Akkermansiaceae bacterium]